jgi:hypothetical protein
VGLEFELSQGFMLATQAFYHFSNTSSPFCSGYLGGGGLSKYFPGLASNHDRPEFSLPSNWDYRHEHWCLAFILIFKTQDSIKDDSLYLLVKLPLT